jgi:hypothetical protein
LRLPFHVATPVLQTYRLPAIEPPRPDHMSLQFGEDGEGFAASVFCLEFQQLTELSQAEDITLRGLAIEACYNPGQSLINRRYVHCTVSGFFFHGYAISFHFCDDRDRTFLLRARFFFNRIFCFLYSYHNWNYFNNNLNNNIR